MLALLLLYKTTIELLTHWLKKKKSVVQGWKTLPSKKKNI